MYLYPSGPNKRTLRGDTRFLAVIDELGWFPNHEGSEELERASATEVYGALDRSLKTIRKETLRLLRDGHNNVPPALGVSISSPSDDRDKIMQLVRAHEGSAEVLAFRCATWEFNPRLEKEDFAKEYRENPVAAERDYGANPPKNANPFITEDSEPERLFTEPTVVQYEYTLHKVKNDPNKLRKAASLTAVRTGRNIPASLMTLDAGFSNNSFTLCIGHLHGTVRETYKFPVLVEVAPDVGRNTINFTRIAEQVIYPLIEQLNVRYVMADRWQGIKLLHDIEERFNIPTSVYSLKYADFELIRNWIIDDERTFFLPKLEVPIKSLDGIASENYPHGFMYKPAAHLYYQMLTVRDNGRSVDKGPNLTDDLFRAFALNAAHLLDEDFTKEHLQGTSVKQGRGGMVAYGQRNAGPMVISSNGIASSNVGSTGSRGGFAGSMPSSTFSRTRR